MSERNDITYWRCGRCGAVIAAHPQPATRWGEPDVIDPEALVVTGTCRSCSKLDQQKYPAKLLEGDGWQEGQARLAQRYAEEEEKGFDGLGREGSLWRDVMTETEQPDLTEAYECPHCHGSGYDAPNYVTCLTCRGGGHLTREEAMAWGMNHVGSELWRHFMMEALKQHAREDKERGEP